MLVLSHTTALVPLFLSCVVFLFFILVLMCCSLVFAWTALSVTPLVLVTNYFIPIFINSVLFLQSHTCLNVHCFSTSTYIIIFDNAICRMLCLSSRNMIDKTMCEVL